MIIIATHAPYDTSGKPIVTTGNALVTFLQFHRFEWRQIVHPLTGPARSFVRSSLATHDQIGAVSPAGSRNLLIKSLKEVLTTCRVVCTQPKTELFIGIDPLNALAGLVLRMLGRVQRLVFFTADYAPERFANPVTNWVYHSLDKLACTWADEVWNVSSRIMAVRRTQGVSPTKSFLVPNAPFLRHPQVDRQPSLSRAHRLIVVTTLASSIEFDTLFQVLSQLRKKAPLLHLTVVGVADGPARYGRRLARLGITKNVTFRGAVSYERLQALIRQAGIGIALYTTQHPWTYYCDSMKARDYLAAGCPVVISDFVSTADDISKAKAGFAIDASSLSQMKAAIATLVLNTRIYSRMSKQALQLAQQTDMDALLSTRFQVLCNTPRL